MIAGTDKGSLPEAVKFLLEQVLGGTASYQHESCLKLFKMTICSDLKTALLHLGNMSPNICLLQAEIHFH